MITCRQCGATHRGDSINEWAPCGSTYFRTSYLWDQTAADLERKIGDDALEGKFPLRSMAVSLLRISVGLGAGLSLLVLLAARMS